MSILSEPARNMICSGCTAMGTKYCKSGAQRNHRRTCMDRACKAQDLHSRQELIKELDDKEIFVKDGYFCLDNEDWAKIKREIE